jgi:hypothetical protein
VQIHQCREFGYAYEGRERNLQGLTIWSCPRSLSTLGASSFVHLQRMFAVAKMAALLAIRNYIHADSIIIIRINLQPKQYREDGSDGKRAR